MSLKATLRKAHDQSPDGGVGYAPSMPAPANILYEDDGVPSPAKDLPPAINLPVRRTVPRVIHFDDSEGAIVGDFTEEDFRLPQLKIVNGNGPMSKQFLQGTLLLKGKAIVPSPAAAKNSAYPTLRFVPVKVVKEFRENLTQEEMADGIRARVVPTYEEALRLGGGHIGYQNNTKGRWTVSGQIWMLLAEPPESDHPAFGRVLDGVNYAGCVLYTSGRAYNSAFKEIMDAAGGVLRINGKRILHQKFWGLKVALQGDSNPSYVPIVEIYRREDTGPEIHQYVAELRGKAQVEEGSEE